MNAHAVSVNVSAPTSSKKRKSREQKARLSALKSDYLSLLAELARAEQALHTALNNFDHLCEPKAVDVCIYQLQAAQSQYDNLMRRLKPLRQQMSTVSGSI